MPDTPPTPAFRPVGPWRMLAAMLLTALPAPAALYLIVTITRAFLSPRPDSVGTLPPTVLELLSITTVWCWGLGFLALPGQRRRWRGAMIRSAGALAAVGATFGVLFVPLVGAGEYYLWACPFEGAAVCATATANLRAIERLWDATMIGLGVATLVGVAVYGRRHLGLRRTAADIGGVGPPGSAATSV